MDTVQYTAEEQAANRAKLVDALRSGDYEQGRGWLRRTADDGDGGDNFEFCCLGVACDISGLGEWEDADFYTVDGAASDTHLPMPVRRWLGFAADNGTLEHPVAIEDGEDSSSVLTDANDSGMSFADIADLIESGEVRTV